MGERRLAQTLCSCLFFQLAWLSVLRCRDKAPRSGFRPAARHACPCVMRLFLVSVSEVQRGAPSKSLTACVGAAAI